MVGLPYVQMDGNAFYIHAARAEHPATTRREHPDVTNLMEPDDLLVDGEDSTSLLLMKGASGRGACTSSCRSGPSWSSTCSTSSALFHEARFFGIDLGTTSTAGVSA